MSKQSEMEREFEKGFQYKAWARKDHVMQKIKAWIKGAGARSNIRMLEGLIDSIPIIEQQGPLFHRMQYKIKELKKASK